MKITVNGTGYVSLVSGTCLAEVDNDVLCLDVGANKIRILPESDIPFYELGLEHMVQKNVAVGRLRFTADIEGERQLNFVATPRDVLNNADALIIVTKWKAFKSSGFSVINSRLKNPVIFDGRNPFEPADINALGFE
ncbi:MAG: UDP binding domain-containing protein [Burkholderiales bacterium]|nr:UDP binding domain-containing protein [Burkholderiales bacterium]